MKKFNIICRVLAVMIVSLFSSNLLPTAVAQAFAPTTTTEQWGKNGADKAALTCSTGQTSYWHWILTPGGNNTLISATLTANYQSGATTTTQGVVRSQSGNAGALHFDVTRPSADTVTSASVVYTFSGNGNGNFVLTISDSTCQGTVTPPTTNVTPVQPYIKDDCGTTNDTVTLPNTAGVVYTQTKAGLVVTVTATAQATYTLVAGNGYTLNQDGTASTTVTLTDTKCPMTVTPCVTTSTNLITQKSQFADYAYQDTRDNGHAEFVSNGLHVYTDNNSSLAKVAWYKGVSYPLSQVGNPQIDYTANTSGTFQNIGPGMQLVMDFNNDGTTDGILVGEPTANGYGNNWWLSNSAPQFAKDGAPHNGSGYGSPWYGTLDEWLTAFPDSQVKAVGFSLGSGVYADGLLKSVTFGCVKYQFQKPEDVKVSPQPPVVNDDCGIKNDSFTLPQNSAQITYSKNGNVVTATLTNPSGYDFGAPLNGYTVSSDGTTATYSVAYTQNQSCITPVACETPRNGGTITQNTPSWTTAGDVSFVKNGLSMSDDEWNGSYIKYTGNYNISAAEKLGWTYDGTVNGPNGIAIIFTTSTGANIHYEPEPYTNDFWTNTPGILPASGVGQGGAYSGSLQDILDTAGDLTITNTYFYFTSANENSIVLKTLSFNCATYKFDKDTETEGRKVFVCKYVGTPNFDERLQSGQNPISVSVNAIKDFNGVGSYFNDAQGRSYVLAFDYGQPEPSVTACPGFEKTKVTPVVVTVIQPTCEMPNGSLIIPSKAGVVYRVNGNITVAGTYTFPAGSIITVKAEAANDLYSLTQPYEQTVTYQAAPTNCVLGDSDTDICPNLPGSQATVPVGSVKDVNGNCVLVTGGLGGGSTLGTSTTGQLPASLPATGGEPRFSLLFIIAASAMAYGATYFVQGRRLNSAKLRI